MTTIPDDPGPPPPPPNRSVRHCFGVFVETAESKARYERYKVAIALWKMQVEFYRVQLQLMEVRKHG